MNDALIGWIGFVCFGISGKTSDKSAFRGVEATLPLGGVAVGAAVDEKGQRLIWLEPSSPSGWPLCAATT